MRLYLEREGLRGTTYVDDVDPRQHFRAPGVPSVIATFRWGRRPVSVWPIADGYGYAMKGEGIAGWRDVVVRMLARHVPNDAAW